MPRILTILFLFCGLSALAQDTTNSELAIGEWRVHLPYFEGYSVAETGDRVYCATTGGLFMLNKADNALKRYSKVQGLSDVTIQQIAFDYSTGILVVAYDNGNIDLIEDDKITNLSDIKRKQIAGKKQINTISFINKIAHLNCGFGIVTLDLERKEIKDTYIIGPNGSTLEVFDSTTDGDTIYAATEKGLYHASMSSPNLANFNAWKRINLFSDSIVRTGTFNALTYTGGKLLANFSMKKTKDISGQDTLYVYENNQWSNFIYLYGYTINYIRPANNFVIVSAENKVMAMDNGLSTFSYIDGYFNEWPEPKQATIDKDKTVWIADRNHGLIKMVNEDSYEQFQPNGPKILGAYSIEASQGIVWAVSGSMNDAWSPPNEGYFQGVSKLENNEWTSAKFTGPLQDVKYPMTTSIDPSDPHHLFTSTLGFGALEFKDTSLVAIHNTSNSGLQNVTNLTGNYTRILGSDYDEDGNLWFSNFYAQYSLVALTKDGSWKQFSLSKVGADLQVGKLMVHNNQKWVVLRDKGIIVYDDKGTIDDVSDDEYKLLDNSPGNGALSSVSVYAMQEDLDGEIWVGSEKGVSVFYSPDQVLSGDPAYDSKQILIEQDGYVQYLLENEVVTAIAVDGSNKKWIGTAGGGVYLMSPDGTRQILHFTSETSPLLSNNILSIGIDHKTGEVYFGTEKGIISYKGRATFGGEVCSDTYAYPNPVKPDYDGLIAIKGLMRDATVRITDISGKLIFTTTAEGGQAIWDGRNLKGQKAQTGVYLIFSASPDGSNACINKLVFIN